MAEQYIDLVETTLSGSINNSTTTIPVTASTGMPASGDYTILVKEGTNRELMHVTSRSSLNLTVATRGSWGTSAFSFTSAATVQIVLSAYAFDAIRANINQIGLYSALPTSGMKQGDWYKCTDCKSDFFYNGSAWIPFFDGFQVTEPSSSSWSWDNQGSSTASVGSGVLNFVAEPGSGVVMYYRTAPATPYTITIRCDFVQSSLDGTNSTAQTSMGQGIAFRDGTGKITFFIYYNIETYWGFDIENWNSSSSFNASVKTHANSNSVESPSVLTRSIRRYMRITDNGTNLLFSHSIDGVTWTQYHSYARTTFMGSGPTQIGIVVRKAANEKGHLHLFDWTVS